MRRALALKDRMIKILCRRLAYQELVSDGWRALAEMNGSVRPIEKLTPKEAAHACVSWVSAAGAHRLPVDVMQQLGIVGGGSVVVGRVKDGVTSIESDATFFRRLGLEDDLPSVHEADAQAAAVHEDAQQRQQKEPGDA